MLPNPPPVDLRLDRLLYYFETPSLIYPPTLGYYLPWDLTNLYCFFIL